MITLTVISKILVMGLSIGFMLVAVLFLPETFRFLRNEYGLQLSDWWKAKRETVEHILLIVGALVLVWLGFVIATPQ